MGDSREVEERKGKAMIVGLQELLYAVDCQR